MHGLDEQELGHLDPVEPGHPDVDQAHVGAEPTRQLDRGVAVGHQHAHRHRRSAVGSSASTVHPPSSAGPAR
ncbi:MAG: hypothetical protein WB798_17370, partial [Nocardioidaceae bacterium]